MNTLIQYLLQKLKTGDARSININAIPGKLATRFDIADLIELDSDSVNIFINKLLTQPTFKFRIDLGNVDFESNDVDSDSKLFNDNKNTISKKNRAILLKRLNTIIASEEDEFQEHGVRSFGFGYPLLVKKISKDIGDDKLIVSPVFIRKLTIERLRSSKYTYQLSRDDEMFFGLNEVLLGNLETNDKITINQITEDIIDTGVLSKSNLIENLNSLLSKCGSGEKYDQVQEIKKIPASKKELEELYGKIYLERPAIFWGGVFGLYRTLKEKIIEDTKKLPIDIQIDDNLDDQDFDFEHPYGCVSTDPSQQTILDNLQAREGMVIQGPPGTGKSQTITAIITNALDNNKKCLVVCEKKTALEVIKTNLSKIGLGDMCALIEDVHTARKNIVELVRNKQEHGFGYIGFKNNEYQATLDEINSVIDKNNNQRKLLQHDYFNNNNRKTLVGKFLQKSKHISHDTIDDLYDYIAQYIQDYSYENYNNLIKIIKKAQELYFFGAQEMYLNNLKKFIFIDSGTYISTKNQYEKFIKQLVLKKENIEKEINVFEQLIEQNKEKYNHILNNNLRLHLKFINKVGIGQNISNLLTNYHVVGNKQLSDELNLLVVEFKSINPKNSDELYDLHLNPNIIKQYINVFEEEVNNQQLFHNKIVLLNEGFNNNIRELIISIQEIKQLSDELILKYRDSDNLGRLHFFKNNLFGIFSSKHKEIKQEHELILFKYQELRKTIFDKNYENLINELKLNENHNTIKSLIQQLETLYQLCNNCSLIEVDSKGLQSIKYDEKITNEREKIIHSFEEVNGLISNHFEFNKPHQIKSLSNMYDQLEFYNKLELNLLENKIELEKFYDWINFYHILSNEQKNIVNAFCGKGISDWSYLFDVIWLKRVLLFNDVNLLPKNDHDILKLYGLIKDLKDHQIKGIKSKWKELSEDSIGNLKSKGITIQSLYNKRGSPGERRNSLRKIIATDFELFTNIFPIVLVSPQVCSSILPLEKDLFDIVLFDEASQIRLEDVMSAMYRGKQKIICGDEHQAPPSNFFTSSNILLEASDDDTEENDDDIKFSGSDLATQLANSESLLDYAEKRGYFQYMLEIHYRSEHPILIDFSNHAFYGGRLKPLPNKKEYVPISFYEVDGLLHKGVNEIEAIKVIETLQNLLSDDNINKKFNGELPSIGIATFNMYQRNYIRDLIQKIKYENAMPELTDKLDYVDLFIKNLDTIQGDERDIIIISTTFAKKSDGKFSQNYGPINQSKGYRLLNVMITRAKKEVHLITSIPSEVYTQFEEKLKNSKSETKHGGSLLHAYINYCKAVHENNESLRLSILEKISGGDSYQEQEEGMTESPFEEEVLSSLCNIIDPNRIKLQYKVGGFRIDMIILSKKTQKPLIAIECDGATYHSGDMAYCNDIFRQDILEGLGFIFHRIWSTNRRRDREKEENELKAFLEGLDEI